MGWVFLAVVDRYAAWTSDRIAIHDNQARVNRERISGIFGPLLVLCWLVCTAGTASAAGGKWQSGGDALTSSVSRDVYDYVDLVELNHFVDEEGRQVFRQVIFYDWNELDKRFHVRAWRLIKSDRQIPQRRWRAGGFECVWNDDECRKHVVAKQQRETWTQQDPERINRKFLPEDQRIPLFRNAKTVEGEMAVVR